MSVRRLADDSVQPAGFTFSSENLDWAERMIGRYPVGRQQSAVIPLLMRAQDQDGWVTRPAIEYVADRLAMPLIRVLEVATFYTQFQLRPVGTRAHVQVCGTTPCMLRGADALKKVCAEKIHPDQFHTNADGTLSWEEVECLGACVNAPMVMVFKDTYEDLTPERLAEIIDAFERGDAVAPGPQIDRHLSVPVGGLTTLNTFDDDDEIGDRADGIEHSGSAPQGAGAGDGAGVAPSQAGRVDTHAEETDPTIRGPGSEKGAAASPAAEDAASADLTEGVKAGSGKTGGTKQGPTGAAAGEVDEEKATLGASAVRDAGELPVREGAAEERVVAGKYRPDVDAPPTGDPRRDVGTDSTRGAREADRAETSDTGTAKTAPGRDAEKSSDDSDESKGS